MAIKFKKKEEETSCCKAAGLIFHSFVLIEFLLLKGQHCKRSLRFEIECHRCIGVESKQFME